MRVASLVLPLALLAGCQEACLDDELTDVPGTISGNLCAEDGSPIALANVTATATLDNGTNVEKSATTQTSGGFTVKNLPPASYVVSYVDDGGVSVEIARDIVVSAQAPAAALPNNPGCREPPAPGDVGSVEGSICNRHVGTLVAGADVIVLVGTVRKTGVTDDNGHFRIDDVPVGEGTVQVIDTGFQRTFPIDVTKGGVFEIELDDNCVVPSTSTGCIIGSICDPAVGPDSNLAGADVVVTNLADANETVTDRTDTLGFVEFCALQPGGWLVDIKKDGRTIHSENVTVAAAETVSVRGPAECGNRVQVGRVEGSLCNEVDGGVFTGRVFLSGQNGGNVSGVTTTTDADGLFAFENVAPGEYTLSFPDNPELAAIPITVTAFQTTALVARNCPLPQQECTDFTFAPEETSDGRIFFVVDKSGSMNEVANGFGGSKWDALKAAVTTVTSTLTSDTIDYALVAYPNPANTDCENDSSCVVACAAGTQQRAMGATGGEVNQSLAGISPFGGTPTAQTLANIKTTIQNLATDDRPLAVVLATDGAPNCAVDTGLRATDLQRTNCAAQFGAGSVCTSTAEGQTDADCAPFNCLDLSAVDRVREISSLGVKVHVVGINAAGAVTGPFTDTLNAMAVAGGAPLAGSTRFYVANDTAALQESLRAITRQILACNITTSFDVGTGAGISLKVGATPILQNSSRTNGWDVTGPNSIQLFGAACDRATASEANVVVTRCVAGN